MPTPTATVPYLIEGALLALEQAGHLLADSAALHRIGSYPTAVAVAQFGREELGRCRILSRLRTDVAAGKVLRLEDVQAACADHVEKQRESLVGGIALRPSRTEGVGKAILSKMESRPDSAEYQHASAAIDLAAKRKLARLPDCRHGDRCEALYVDPAPNGTTWNRPRDMTSERSRVAIEDLLNDYASEFTRAHREESAHRLVANLPKPDVGLVALDREARA